MDKTYVFSAPGRTEIGGNHTDHQRGCVLAAAVNLETIAKITLNSSEMKQVRAHTFDENKRVQRRFRPLCRLLCWMISASASKRCWAGASAMC